MCARCDYVQQTLGKYLTDLASLGVAGFRIDASKHQQAVLQGEGARAVSAMLECAARATLSLHRHAEWVSGWQADQLGKVLAKEVGKGLVAKSTQGFNASTSALIAAYMEQ